MVFATVMLYYKPDTRYVIVHSNLDTSTLIALAYKHGRSKKRKREWRHAGRNTSTSHQYRIMTRPFLFCHLNIKSSYILTKVWTQALGGPPDYTSELALYASSVNSMSICSLYWVHTYRKIFQVTSDGLDSLTLHSHPVQQSVNDHMMSLPCLSEPSFSADLFSKLGSEERASLISFTIPETGAY